MYDAFREIKRKSLLFSDIYTKKENKDLRKSVEKNLEGKTLIVSSNEEVEKALRNLSEINVVKAEKVNSKNLADCRKVIIDNEAVKILEERLTNGK
jgi:ribosomal protein L4